MKLKKLAIIITHPIQYYVPLFQLLATKCELKVFYTWGEKGALAKYDPDFKQVVDWDLPLLEGYAYEFLTNTSQSPGSHHYRGIVNPGLKQSVKLFEPSAILVYGWAYQSHLTLLHYFKGKVPIWFRGDSTLIAQQHGIKQVLRKWVLKWVYQHIDKAFYVGTANKLYFEAFGLKKAQLVFAPHAVENARFAKDRSQESTTLRQQFGIGTDEILILFAGKLERKKNPELLLKAFIELDLNGVHLLFVGNGELEEDLKIKTNPLPPPTPSKGGQNLSLEKKVHFLDFQNQSQMPVVYQACDLFCLPSHGSGETWGLAVNEAMACGKAILLSDEVGCAVDLVKNGENGYIFESNQLIDLKSKLNLLLDKVNLTAMGKKSKRIIEDWSIAKQAEIIFKELHR